MDMIGGNRTLIIQLKTVTQNEIGEQVEGWIDKQSFKGFLDLQVGDSGYTNYDSKIQESTHYFIADYQPVDASINLENCRAMVDTKVFDVMLIDNPMELNDHLEFYLKYTGGR